MKYLIALLLSSSLAADLSPEYCRRVGVQVADGAPMTGGELWHHLRAAVCGHDAPTAEV